MEIPLTMRDRLITMSQILKKLFFWLDQREIVYWQGISSFSTLAQYLHFRQKAMKRLDNKKSWLMLHNSGLIVLTSCHVLTSTRFS
jgi:hypothetical protein